MGNLRISYAGIGVDASSGVSFTLQRGINPGICHATLKAGTLKKNVPKNGDLYISDGTTNVTIPMWVDGDIEEKETTNGTFLNVTLKDRRWLWKYGSFYKITNQPDKSGVPQEQEDARSILGKARDVIGVPGSEKKKFDVSAAKENDYPAVEYEGDNPAQCIEEICEDLGLCVCLQTVFNNPDDPDDPDNGKQKTYLRILGTGDSLPSTGKYEESVLTTPTHELPSEIHIIGSRIVNESTFTDWEPVGTDTAANDHEIKNIDDLSYSPSSKGWTSERDTWLKVISREFIDYTDDEEKKLAKKCVYKWYRWNPPKAGGATTRKIMDTYLPWLNMRSRPSKNSGGSDGNAWDEDERDDPFLIANYTKKVVSGEVTMYKDYNDPTKPQEIIDGYHIDIKKGIIKFSKITLQRSADNADPTKLPSVYSFDYPTALEPTISLTIAFDKSNTASADDYYKYEYECDWPKKYPSNCGPYIVHKPELVQYNSGNISYNETELKDYTRWISEKIQKQFWNELTGASKTYIGIKDVSPDGAIDSVTWNISKAGATTTIQRGRDKPPAFMPTYKWFLAQLRQQRQSNKGAVTAKNINKKIGQTRGGTAQRDAGGQVSDIPIKEIGQVLVRNISGFDAKTGSMAEVAGIETSTGAVEISQPLSNDSENVVILQQDIIATGYGIASESGTGYILHTGTTPVLNDKLGSVANQWEAEVSEGGSHIVRGSDSDDNFFGNPIGGGGVDNFCKIVDSGGVQVLKKCDPSNPLSLSSFDKADITEVYEGITGDTLDVANYPNNTFVIVYKDSSGHYFVHPFAQWRPYS